MDDELYFAQDALREFADALVEGDGPEDQLRRASERIRGAEVEFPQFGLLGIGFAIAYGQVKDYGATYIAAGADQLVAWEERMDVVADMLEEMEAANSVAPP